MSGIRDNLAGQLREVLIQRRHGAVVDAQILEQARRRLVEVQAAVGARQNQAPLDDAAGARYLALLDESARLTALLAGS